jgi:Zn-dependent protease with chaperone function
MSEADPVARSKHYSVIKTRIFLIDLVLTVVALAVFQAFFSIPVANAAREVSSNFFVVCFIYSTVFLFFMYITSLPLNIYSAFYIEHRFGLSDQKIFAWCGDQVKSAVLTFMVAVIGIEVFYLLLRSCPNWWPLALAFVWILFSVVLTRIAPVIVVPLFFHYLPVEDEELGGRLIALSRAAGISLMDICRIDFSKKTKKANAALVGLGKSRKVILADTLTDEFTHSEIEMVVAHELGHHKFCHIWQLLAFSGVVTTVGFYLLYLVLGRVSMLLGVSSSSDLSIFPMLIFLLMAFSLAVLPLQNFFSRILEKQADRFALDLTGEPAIFIRTMEKLGEMNLADLNPSALKKIFLYNHPPINERIEMAKKWEASREE